MRLLEGLMVCTAVCTAVAIGIMRVVVHRTGLDPKRAFALYLGGWAIVGVVLGVAAQTLAWYVGAEAPRGLLGIAVDLVIAAIAFPLVGALLYPVAVMAAGSGRSASISV
jgi:hypothetical protein